MTIRPDGLVAIPPSANLRRCVMSLWTHGHAFSLYKTSLLTPLLRHDTTRQGTARRNATINDISIRCRVLWDQKHEGAVRICQCTRSVAPTVLMFPSDPWNRNPAVQSQSLPICQHLHSFAVVASSPTYDISNIDGNLCDCSVADFIDTLCHIRAYHHQTFKPATLAVTYFYNLTEANMSS